LQRFGVSLGSKISHRNDSKSAAKFLMWKLSSPCAALRQTFGQSADELRVNAELTKTGWDDSNPQQMVNGTGLATISGGPPVRSRQLATNRSRAGASLPASGEVVCHRGANFGGLAWISGMTAALEPGLN
jgi:hypothetical protein